MAAVNKRRDSGHDFGLNSGVLLSILKDRRVKSDIASQIIHEWSKHVSHIS